ATQGAILVDQIRSVDRSERMLRRLGRAPDEVLRMVRRKRAALTGIEFAAGSRGPEGM
ncbi:MAG: type II toxin-antitoxin system PemK/MazF family toxin, partial [Pseudorhodoplanes sp.]|nr:type II toxin-antitoxin system PemK/MazF family toxin [Pseudorhodoplanes sp.]